MVNLILAQKPLFYGIMRIAGVRPHHVDIEQDTVMNFWVPSECIGKAKSRGSPDTFRPPSKPVVVLIHGFATDGIFTWQFQVPSLTRNYAVYIPDLLFFGDSTTKNSDRSPAFQSKCIAEGLKKMGVRTCTLVGFSYGGIIAFRMAEMYPKMVRAMVISGSVSTMTDTISESTLDGLGVSSSSDLLLPRSVNGVKALFKVAMHKKIWLPDRLHRDFLEAMFTNINERKEMLEALVATSEKDSGSIANLDQRIHLLWGEEDLIFPVALAHDLKGQLGERATFQSIKNAGHLVHLERPCTFNRCLKQFLDTHMEETSSDQRRRR